MPNENNNDKYIIEMAIKGLEETKRILQNVQNDNQVNAISMTALRAEVNIMRQDTNWLINSVRDEGGDRNVMARLLALEKDFEDLDEKFATQITDKKKREESESSHLNSITSEDHKAKWQLRIALATGCLGFIATIITAILGFYLKK